MKTVLLFLALSASASAAWVPAWKDGSVAHPAPKYCKCSDQGVLTAPDIICPELLVECVEE